MLRSLVFVCSSFATLCFAQQPVTITGTFVGTLDNHPVRLHLESANGTVTCKADSPGQNLMGMPCANVSLKGQALGFSVPAVRGSWTGFVSADNNSLVGIWSQGAPAQLNFTRLSNGSEQAGMTRNDAGPKSVNWDNYVYRFDPTGQSAIVYEGVKPVARIRSTNGKQEILVLPGNDAEKIKRSFADYQSFANRSTSGAPVASVPVALENQQPAAVPPAPIAAAPVSTCTLASLQSSEGDEAHGVVDEAGGIPTVTRSDGISVRFEGQDTKINCGPLIYTLRRRNGSIGRVLESGIMHPRNHGGSASGAGVEFLFNGSLLYDSGMGTYGDLQTSTKLRSAKRLSKIAVSAVADVRNVPGHQDFTPPGYSDMKDLAQYKLRSDGSR